MPSELETPRRYFSADSTAHCRTYSTRWSHRNVSPWPHRALKVNNLEFYPLLHQYPVQPMKHWLYTSLKRHPSQDVRHCILYQLDFPDQVQGQPSIEQIIAVQPGVDHCRRRDRKPIALSAENDKRPPLKAKHSGSLPDSLPLWSVLKATHHGLRVKCSIGVIINQLKLEVQK